GNIDNWRFGPGSAMHDPVVPPGALCYLGDPPLAEGDGELSGTALAAPANAIDEDLDRAMKSAARALLSFLVEQRGLSRDDAYSLISGAGDFGVTRGVSQRHAGDV